MDSHLLVTIVVAGVLLMAIWSFRKALLAAILCLSLPIVWTLSARGNGEAAVMVVIVAGFMALWLAKGARQPTR